MSMQPQTTASDIPALLEKYLPAFWADLPTWLTQADIDGLYPLFAYLFDYAAQRWNESKEDPFFQALFSLEELLLAAGDDQVVDAVAIELIHPISSPQYHVQEWAKFLSPLARQEYDRYMQA